MIEEIEALLARRESDRSAEWAVSIARIATRIAGSAAKPLEEYAAAHPEMPITTLLEFGDEFFRAGVLDGAAVFYRRLLVGAETGVRLHAYFKLGQIARALQDPASALANFEAAARLDPKHPAIAFELVSALLETTGREREAFEIWNNFSWSPAYASRLAILVAKAKRRRGEHAAAAKCLERALEAAQDDRQLLAELISSYVAAGQPDLAIERLLHHHAHHAPSEFTLRLLGKAYIASCDFEAAASAFAAACERAPDRWECWVDRGSVALELGDFAGARTFGEAAAQRAPNLEAPRRIIAESHRRGGNIDAYVAALDEAAACNPAAIRSRLDLLIQRLSVARPPSVRDAFERAGADILGDAACLTELARHALADLQADAALKILARAEEISPASSAGRLVRAQALFQKGNSEEAMALLQFGQSFSGADSDFLLKACELLLAQGEHYAAYSLLHEHPSTGFRWTALAAEAMLAAGDTSTAAEFVTRCVPASFEERLRVIMLKVRLLEAKGEDDAASRMLEDADELTQGHAGLLTERLRLAIKTGEFDRAKKIVVQLRSHDKLMRGHGKVNGRPWDLAREICVEWELDREAKTALDVVLATSEEEVRLRTLALAVRAWPDNTLIAIHYLRHARRSDARCISTGADVPATIYQYWHDGEPPADLSAYVKSVRSTNPDCRHILLDAASAGRMLSELPDQAVLSAFLRAPEIAQKADLLRLALLYQHGGWYVDIDTRGHAPLASLQRGAGELIGYFDPFAAVANDVIGAAPGHPAVGRALRAVTESILRNERDSVWLCTGPGALTRAVAGWLETEQGRATWSVNLYDLTSVRSIFTSHCAAAYKMTNAHWSRSGSGTAVNAIERLWRTVVEIVNGK